jgi:6-phosphofructokinase 1
MEVMGRHAGWIAAAGGLAATEPGASPHIILFPEIEFDEDAFLAKVKASVENHGFCSIVVSEGIRNKQGKFLSDAGLKDAFGHTQLGGVAPVIANLIKQHHGYKYHWAVCDYLQRAARHIASKTDVEHAYALGEAAVELAISGKNAVMPVVVRDNASPYQWHIEDVALEKVANVEKPMPRDYISEDGFSITEKCREYLTPLIQGEAYPPYNNSGLPEYVKLKNQLVEPKL